MRVGPGEQAGLTKWDALLPTDSSLSMCAAIDTLAAQYRQDNPQLTVAASRADALVDLVLSDVQVTTTATLIIPTTDAPAPDPAGPAGHRPSREPDPASAADLLAEHAGEPMGPGWHGHAHTDSPDRADSQATDPGQDGPTAWPTDDAPSSRPADRASRAPAMRPSSRPMIGRASPAADPAAAVTARAAPAPGSTCWPRSTVRLSCWPGRGPSSCPTRRCRDGTRGSWRRPSTPTPTRTWPATGTGGSGSCPRRPSAAPVGLLLPAQVNAILADPDTIIRLGTANPHTGAVEHLDEQTYRPGAKLARLVRARDGTCRYPGCATPAQRCDLDHVIAYPAGPTTAANLQTLCRVHHGFKHHGGWTVTMTPEGVCTWTAPNGRSHTTHPIALHDDAA